MIGFKKPSAFRTHSWIYIYIYYIHTLECIQTLRMNYMYICPRSTYQTDNFICYATTERWLTHQHIRLGGLARRKIIANTFLDAHIQNKGLRPVCFL